MNINKKKFMIVTAVFAVAILGLIQICFFKNKNGDVFKSAEGTKDDPYIIDSQDDFLELVKAINDGESFSDHYFVISQDIDMSSATDYAPAGLNSGTSFCGTLNGYGHKISNLKCNNADRAGLFNSIDGSIFNLVIDKDCSFKSDNLSGAFAIELLSNGKIINCLNLSSVRGKRIDDDKKSETAGGLVYQNDGYIVNSASFVDRDADSVQKLVDNYSEDYVKLENCYTYDGKLYDLFSVSNETMLDRTRQTALKGLNGRIMQLYNEFDGEPFCIWEMGEHWPVLSAGVARYVKDTNVTNLSYDFDNHSYVLDGLFDDKFSIILSDDNEIIVNNANQYDEILVSIDGVSWSFRTLESIDKYQVNVGSFDINGNEILKETIYQIFDSGVYEFSGEIAGRINVVPRNNNSEIVLNLNNAKFISRDYPALLVDKNDSLDDLPTIRLVVMDNTVNSLEGDCYFDSYSKKAKREGAISTEADIIICGTNSSRLRIVGSLEAVEGQKNVYVEGGNIDIFCSDDGFSVENNLVLNPDYLHFDVGDDAIDVENPVIKGGIITGSAPNESVCKHGTIDGGTVVMGCDMKNRLNKEQAQHSIEIESDHLVDYIGKVAVLADSEDNALLAYKINDSYKRILFSDEKLSEGEYHFYICDDVVGSFVDELCTDITKLNNPVMITSEGSSQFVISKKYNAIKAD